MQFSSQTVTNTRNKIFILVRVVLIIIWFVLGGIAMDREGTFQRATLNGQRYSIEIHNFPGVKGTTTLRGKTLNVPVSLNHVLVYIFNGNGWWNAYNGETPTIKLNIWTGEWECKVDSELNGTSISKIVAIVVPWYYETPILSGEHELPSSLLDKAITYCYADRIDDDIVGGELPGMDENLWEEMVFFPSTTYQLTDGARNVIGTETLPGVITSEGDLELISVKKALKPKFVSKIDPGQLPM